MLYQDVWVMMGDASDPEDDGDASHLLKNNIVM